jgi:hypothetical protein
MVTIFVQIMSSRRDFLSKLELIVYHTFAAINSPL